MNQRTLIGAVVAAILAIAVYYGLLTRQSADNIQNQADQTLGTSPPATPSTQQSTPPTSPTTTPPTTPAGPVPQRPTPAPSSQ